MMATRQPYMSMLSDKGHKDLEELFALKREALQILDLVVAEWASDPMSVKCFDLRTVARAKQVMERIKTLDVMYP